MSEHLLGLDIGTKYVGIAISSLESRLASPLTTIEYDQQFISKLIQLKSENNVNKIIIGLPRDINGNETDQTRLTKKIAEEIKNELGVEIVFMDEALTSIKAKEELNRRGKMYSKGDIDSLSASYILEDYFKEVG